MTEHTMSVINLFAPCISAGMLLAGGLHAIRRDELIAAMFIFGAAGILVGFAVLAAIALGA